MIRGTKFDKATLRVLALTGYQALCDINYVASLKNTEFERDLMIPFFEKFDKEIY